MRNQWYADNRDIVKWASLTRLAAKHNCFFIIHVAMLRPDRFDPAHLQLEINGDRDGEPITTAYHWFRDIKLIERQTFAPDIKVHVIGDNFKWTPEYSTRETARRAYFENVVKLINEHRDTSLIAFLDPDTGIEPANAGWEHLTEQDIKGIFQAIKTGDLMVVYQHQQREDGWIESRRIQLANSINANIENINSYTCTLLASDVVLFAIQKP